MTKLYYRADVDGLRAIAVIGVLLFHAEIPSLSGGFTGVDIFFVISGYLISSILILELENKGHVNYIDFWARRTKRLLPSALLVIILTLISAYYILSNVQFYYAIRDSVWASTYLINWTKLSSAVQYFDDGGQHGPFLHYWSLAVEEQFYLILIAIFFLAIQLKKIPFFNNNSTSSIVILFIFTIAIISFILNIYSISIAQPISFFGTHARVWELALGVAVGVIERKNISPSIKTRSYLSWLGIALIVGSYFILSSDTKYPGYFALIPTIGAVAFLLAGINQKNQPLPIPLKLFSTNIPVSIGKLSYSLYLWHWSVFVLWRNHFGLWTYLDITFSLVITWVLAWISFNTVENPIRYSKYLTNNYGYSLIGASILTLIFVLSALQLNKNVSSKNLIVLSGGNAFQSEEIRTDYPLIYKVRPRCHLSQKAVRHPECMYGSSEKNKTIFLFGDSHAAQWFPAVHGMTERNNFTLYSRTKSSCSPLLIQHWNINWKREYSECSEWRDTVLNEIIEVKPDYVFLAVYSKHEVLDSNKQLLIGEERLEALLQAEKRTIEKIRESGASVILIEDTPLQTADPLDCLVENPKNDTICKTPLIEALKNTFPLSIDSNPNIEGVYLLDMNSNFCYEDGMCYVTDGEFIYTRDKDHISKQYAIHLSSDFEKRFFGIIE